MPRLKAIVFDLDDTLYPEVEFVQSGFRHVSRWAAEQFGIPASQIEAGFRAQFDAGNRNQVFDEWLSAQGLDESYLSALVSEYRHHKPCLSCDLEVESLLCQLATSYQLGLVSDGYLEVQQRKFNALGISQYFSAVVFSDEFGVEHWKPDALPYLTVLDRLGVQPSQTLYVADNPRKDFLGARQAGIRSIRIRRKEGVYARLEPETDEHAPDLEIAAIGDLVASLTQFDSPD